MATKTAASTKGRSKPEEKKPGTGVAKAGGTAPSTEVMSMMEQSAGVGVSHRAEDNIVPLVYVLQAQSPQAIRGNKEAYVKGAEAGSIWLRGTDTVFPAGDPDDEEKRGILFQPCHYSKKWIEWLPNRGGFVQVHNTPNDSEKPPAVAEQKALDPQKPNNMSWVMPNGNIVSQSREWAGHIIDEETMQPIGGYVIPMTGSNIAASRTLNSLLRKKKLPSGKEAPVWGFLYRLNTIFRSNDDGDWYMWDPKDGGTDDEGNAVPMMVPSMELFNLGKKTHEDFLSGAKRADNPENEGGGDTADNGM